MLIQLTDPSRACSTVASAAARRGAFGARPPRGFGRLAWVPIIAVGILNGSSAAGQQAGAAPLGGAQPAGNGAQAPAREAALELYEQGKTAYRAGDFARAADLLERAYALFPAPVLLYNLARARESKGDDPGAVEAYRRYLAGDDDAEDRPAIERRVATLEQRMAAAERAVREREAAIERARRAELAAGSARRSQVSAPSPYPWLMLGTGLATLLAGGVFGALAQQKGQDAAHEPTQLGARDTFEQAERHAVVANVLFAVGGALSVGATVWISVRLAASESSTPDGPSAQRGLVSIGSAF